MNGARRLVAVALDRQRAERRIKSHGELIVLQ